MLFSRSILGVYLCLISSATCLTPAEWRDQSIYQVIVDRFARTDLSTSASCDVNNYCGGTYSGLIKKLDYIQGMGFTAIWISPVVKNIEASTQDGSAYHGYWAQDIYAINEHFGTSDDLKSLSTELHDRGMHLMVDVVTNHFAYAGCGDCVDYSTFNPFNQESDFHPFCLIDYNNHTSIIDCWEGDNIVALADVKTEDSNVADVWNEWIANLVANYSIDGLRVDSMQQVNSEFWQPFQRAADGIHAIGEVFNGDPNYLCPYQQQLSGVLNYPTYYTITHAFQSTSGDIGSLVNGINQMKSTCQDVTVLGSFLENHDNPRFPSYTSDLSLIKNAVAFPLLADGIPILYQGQEQLFSGAGVPNNREALWTSSYNTDAVMYKFVTTLNKIRSWAITKDSAYLTYMAWPIQNTADTIVMRKGFPGQQVISVFNNRGASSSDSDITIGSGNSGFTAGQQVTDILTCSTSSADGNGNLAITIVGGLPQILFPSAALSGSGICGN